MRANLLSLPYCAAHLSLHLITFGDCLANLAYQRAQSRQNKFVFVFMGEVISAEICEI